LIGNSGRLLSEKNKFASEIDSKQLVVRMNAAPFKSFEKFVGSKGFIIIIIIIIIDVV
jgi:hypothetical protein